MTTLLNMLLNQHLSISLAFSEVALLSNSCSPTVLLFFHKILTSSSQNDVVYLDFKKAFDSVAHNELLLKLWKFGICGSLWLWTKAYLTNRLQYVAVGQSLSSALPILSVFLREIFLANYLLQYLLTISPHPSRPPPFFSLPMMLNVLCMCLLSLIVNYFKMI